MTTSFQVGSFYSASTTYWKYDRPVIFKCCRRTDKSVWLQEVKSQSEPPRRIKIHVWHGDDTSPKSESATCNRWFIYSYRFATDNDFRAANLKPPHATNGQLPLART